MKKRIRIKDIAERAGVSTGTVDRVIHQRGNVSKKAEERVRAVMQELDYEPNLLASTLAYNRHFRMASLMPDYRHDPYWAKPKLGVERAISAVQNYNISWEPLFFDLFDTRDFRKQAARLLKDPPDGLLLAPIFLEAARELLAECARRQLPVVKINTDVEDPHALCYVGQDSYQSGVLAGKLLNFKLSGHSAVMILHLDKETTSAQHLIDKEKGFRKFFSALSGTRVQIIKREFPQFDEPDRLRQFMREQLNTIPRLGGIFITNSRAYKMLDCAHDLLPPSTGIVGFDLLEQNLHYLRQGSLSFLINQNPVQQGYQGIMNLTNHLLLKKEVEPMQYLPLDIVVAENYSYYIQREKAFQLVL